MTDPKQAKTISLDELSKAVEDADLFYKWPGNKDYALQSAQLFVLLKEAENQTPQWLVDSLVKVFMAKEEDRRKIDVDTLIRLAKKIYVDILK